MQAMEGGQARYQPMPGKGRAGVDDQLIRLAVLIEPADATGQLPQQGLGGFQQVDAGVGEGDAAALPEEQRLLQRGFQAPDLLADGRLGQMQFLGGPVETTQAGGGLETTQRVQRWPMLEHFR